MKFTQYYESMRLRPDRALIEMAWIQKAIEHPVKETIQQDGRIRRWAKLEEAGGKYLRVILFADDETLHNAFFDRNFAP